jgi:hypothetical protein
MRITRKYKSAGKEILENNDFVGLRGRDLFTRKRVSITSWENPAFSYSLIILAVTFVSPKTKAGG